LTALERHYQQQVNKRFRHFVFRFVIVSWAGILVVNFVVLAVIYWSFQKGWLRLESTQEEDIFAPIATNQILVQEPSEADCSRVCAPQCQDWFDTALATLSAEEKTTQTVMRAETGGVKEYYVPLGSLTAKSFGQWRDTGMQAYVDLRNYGSGAKVYFEASMSIPTANGKVFLRLVQANENFYVPSSEISAGSSQPVIVSSPPLILSSGNKLYKVQLKTSMDYEAIIGFSRLKIVL